MKYTDEYFRLRLVPCPGYDDVEMPIPAPVRSREPNGQLEIDFEPQPAEEETARA